MSPKNVYLPATRVDPEVREQLEAIAAAHGPDTTLADVVRQALREFIARHGMRK